MLDKDNKFEDMLGSYFIIFSAVLCIILFVFDLLNGDNHFDACMQIIEFFMIVGLVLKGVKSVENIVSIIRGK